MKEKDPEELSWALRFIITCISFFIFSWFTKFIGGPPPHVTFFAIIGFIALGLAAIFFITNVITVILVKEKNIPAPSKHENLC